MGFFIEMGQQLTKYFNERSNQDPAPLNDDASDLAIIEQEKIDETVRIDEQQNIEEDKISDTASSSKNNQEIGQIKYGISEPHAIELLVPSHANYENLALSDGVSVREDSSLTTVPAEEAMEFEDNNPSNSLEESASYWSDNEPEDNSEFDNSAISYADNESGSIFEESWNNGMDDGPVEQNSEYNNNTLIPDNITDDNLGSTIFADEFASRYEMSPFFFTGTFHEAMEESCMKPTTERRMLALVSYNGRDESPDQFHRSSVCTVPVINILVEHFVLYGVDMTTESRKMRSFEILKEGLGQTETSRLFHNHPSGLPAMVLIS